MQLDILDYFPLYSIHCTVDSRVPIHYSTVLYRTVYSRMLRMHCSTEVGKIPLPQFTASPSGIPQSPK